MPNLDPAGVLTGQNLPLDLADVLVGEKSERISKQINFQFLKDNEFYSKNCRKYARGMWHILHLAKHLIVIVPIIIPVDPKLQMALIFFETQFNRK